MLLFLPLLLLLLEPVRLRRMFDPSAPSRSKEPRRFLWFVPVTALAVFLLPLIPSVVVVVVPEAVVTGRRSAFGEGAAELPRLLLFEGANPSRLSLRGASPPSSIVVIQ